MFTKPRFHVFCLLVLLWGAFKRLLGYFLTVSSRQDVTVLQLIKNWQFFIDIFKGAAEWVQLRFAATETCHVTHNHSVTSHWEDIQSGSVRFTFFFMYIFNVHNSVINDEPVALKWSSSEDHRNIWNMASSHIAYSNVASSSVLNTSGNMVVTHMLPAAPNVEQRPLLDGRQKFRIGHLKALGVSFCCRPNSVVGFTPWK